MATVTLDVLTFSNATVVSEYNEDTLEVTSQQVDPADLVVPQGEPARTFAPGAVILELRQDRNRIRVIATETAPYARRAIDRNFYTNTCDLDIRPLVLDENAATITVTAETTHPPIEYRLENTAYQVSNFLESVPYGPGYVYCRDAANCERRLYYVLSEPSGGGETTPQGRQVDVFSFGPGIEYKSFYVKESGARRIDAYHTPEEQGERVTVTTAERGRAPGSLIEEFCEGQDMVQFLSSNRHPFVTINVLGDSTSCGFTPPVCGLFFEGYGSKPTTSAGSATGLIGVLIATNASNPEVRIAEKLASGQAGTFTNWTATTKEGDFYLYNFSTLKAGAYFVEAKDDNPLGCQIREEINVPEFERAGCRDPAALNYDPLAVKDGDVCEYAPVLKTDIFAVPETNSLRFYIPPTSYAVNGPFRTSVNTPWDALQQPGVVHPGYCQKVAKVDTLTIQFKSNFATHVVQLREKASGAVVRTFPATRIVQGQGNTATFDGYLTAHNSNVQARAYFRNGVLPLPFVVGNRITIAGTQSTLDGTYPIIKVGEDAAEGVPYLVINALYGQATTDQRVDCNVTTTYDVQKFDTWQTTLSFSTVATGCYDAVITATTPGASSARAVSEPIDVASAHPGTVLISYRNYDNAYDINYSHGIEHRLRVTARLTDNDDVATTKEILVGSDSRTHLLASTARLQARLVTFQLPAQLHVKLSLAFAHDLVRVQGIRYVVEGKYERTAQEKFGLWNGAATLTQVEWLGAGNSDDLGDLNTGQGLIVGEEGFIRY